MFASGYGLLLFNAYCRVFVAYYIGLFRVTPSGFVVLSVVIIWLFWFSVWLGVLILVVGW